MYRSPWITSAPSVHQAPRLLRQFWVYAGFTAATMLGFSTFGVLSFHMVERQLVPPALVHVLYAGAMAVDAGSALITGWMYDGYGPKVLVALPVVAAAIPALAFTNSILPVVIGALLWGAALGIQESTLRATVADLVSANRRSTAYGVFAAVVGVATAGGGILAGGLYDVSISRLIGVTAVIQLAALILFLLEQRHERVT